MKHLTATALMLSLAVSVSATPSRVIPLTSQAETQIQSIRASLPDSWEFLGMLRPKSSREINYSLLGIGGEVLDRDFADFHAYKEFLEPLGAKRIRLQSGWAKTEKERGVYDFSWLDAIIDQSLERGIAPWLELSYGNLIYPGAGGTGLGEGLIKSAEGFAAWDRYVEAATKRYARRVTYYEIWNEADLNHRGSHEPSLEEKQAYARLFVRTAEIVRRHDPDAFIIGLALAGVGNRETVEIFMQYLAQTDNLPLLDGVSIHGYPQNPDRYFEHVARMRAYLDQFDPGLVIWQGETGAPSANQPEFALRNLDWTELSQAKWNTRRALAHIGRGIPFSQFQISDMYYAQKERRNTLNTKGLLQARPDLSIERPKLAYYTYQHVCSFFSDGTLPQGPVEGLETTHSSLAAFRFSHDLKGKSAFALWDDSARPGESLDRTNTSFALPSFRVSNPVYIDLLSGAVYALPPEYITLHGPHATLTNIPIWDAPILITDRSLVDLL